MKRPIVVLPVVATGILVVGLSAAIPFISGSDKTAESAPDDLPEMITLSPAQFSYRPAGEFRNGARVLNAPEKLVTIAENLEIMRYPVTEAAYSECVASGKCTATFSSGEAGLPQTQVSYRDAVAFAEWQSERTGQTWRLPTGPEWAYAAADRYEDQESEELTDSEDPSERWLREYRASAERRSKTDEFLHPVGYYGENEAGVGYIGGNVWEWTSTCFKKGEVGADGELLRQTEDYCGVRLAAGLHRAFIIDFVRDARAGGCAVGLPPDYLAIRLIRES